MFHSIYWEAFWIVWNIKLSIYFFKFFVKLVVELYDRVKTVSDKMQHRDLDLYFHFSKILQFVASDKSSSVIVKHLLIKLREVINVFVYF